MTHQSIKWPVFSCAHMRNISTCKLGEVCIIDPSNFRSSEVSQHSRSLVGCACTHVMKQGHFRAPVALRRNLHFVAFNTSNIFFFFCKRALYIPIIKRNTLQERRCHVLSTITRRWKAADVENSVKSASGLSVFSATAWHARSGLTAWYVPSKIDDIDE